MAGEVDLKRVSDELAIHKVLAEYCLRLEVEGFDHWLEIFTKDTVYVVYGKTLDGRDAMAEMLSKAPHGLHMCGPSRIEIDGDTATTIQSYLFLPEEGAKWNMGWYHRTLVRTDEGWKISRTEVKMKKLTPYASAA
jgi:hypothetical protein